MNQEKAKATKKHVCFINLLDTDGTKYLLRISPASRYKARKVLFAILEKVAAEQRIV